MESNVTIQQQTFEMTAVGQMLKQFEVTQRMGQMYAAATIVPDTYKGNVANCAIAINMAARMGADPMMVMQNLYMVHGNPSFSSKFLVSCINACGRFTPLQYEIEYDANDSKRVVACRAYAYPISYRETGDGRTDNSHRLYGEWVTWKMVESEGWSKKSGSKWLTMPGQMFRYRAAAFWQRAYAPEISMGMLSTEEASEMEYVDYEEVKDKKPRKKKQAEALAMLEQSKEAVEETHAEPEVEPVSEEAAPTLDALFD